MKTITKHVFVVLIKMVAVLTASGSFLTASAQEGLKGPVVLTLSGRVSAQPTSQTVVFDMDRLQALPQHTFTTQTPWDVQPITFTGPRLRDVLAQLKARGSQLRAIALNDYRVKIPVSDADQFDMVVALRMNGQPISVRTKGPLFIVYPFDAQPVLQKKLYYERAIWQLKAIEVE